MNSTTISILSRLFETHRLVFWYDTEKSLGEEFEALTLPDVEKLVIDNNEFGIKVRVLHEQPAKKFLLYHRGPRPEDEANWLLDLLLANTEFCTDEASLILSDLGLDNKGVKTKAGNSGDYYGIIRHGTANNIPTIIVEHCFIDHPYDRALLERVGTSAFAHADAEGIIRYVDEYDSLGSACHVLEDLKESEVHPVSESNIVEKLKASVSHIIR